jgi:hypothetical protein
MAKQLSGGLIKVLVTRLWAIFILSEIDKSSRVDYSLHNQGDLHIRRRENLK